MADFQLAHAKRRVQRHYEWQRACYALLGALPLVGLTFAALHFSARAQTTLLFGVGAFVAAVALLWCGRDAQRAVLPGFVAGGIPLVLSLWANQTHGCCASNAVACGPTTVSMCVVACSAGGLLAGGLVALIGKRLQLGPWYWRAAASMSLLVGAMGCACIGYTGVIGMAVGYALGAQGLRALPHARGV